MTTKTRAYAFTLNNYDDTDEARVRSLADTASYVVCGKEVAPSTGTLHLQGYVYFKSQRAFSSVKALLGDRAHIEAAKASAKKNRDYCTKDGVWFEHGEMPQPGARTDIAHIRKVLDGGGNMKEVTAVAHSMQAVSIAKEYLKYHEKPRDWKPEVHWYHGSTGAGKTRQAREWLGDGTYTCLDNGKFWEGYDAHESVLIDDMRRDFCKYHQLLKILDRYEYRVETKGGSRQLRARKIAITAPYPPDEMYNTREDINQLLRRIDRIILVGQRVRIQEDDDPLGG